MSVSNKVIGFTGPFGSGCSTAAEYLSSKLGYKYVRLSDQLRAIWAARHRKKKDPPRRELQNLGDALRRREGADVLVRSSLGRVDCGGILVDGIRNAAEIDFLRDRCGYHFMLFGVIPTFRARWERIGAERYSDSKEGQMSFFADDARDQDEEIPYGQQVRKCIDQADILIDNSESVTLGDYKRKVLELAEMAIGKTHRPPSREEIFMNMAYSACHSSRCLKRHVGAVVIDAGGNPVGIGYNENPTGTLSCEKQYDDCFKDMKKTEHLQQLASKTGRLYCPICGTIIKKPNASKMVCGKCSANGYGKPIADMLFPERGMSFCTAIHAEVWALSAAGERARGGELFSTTYPCLQCAEKIIHAGIKRVWYTEPYPDAVSGNRLWLGHVDLRQFEGVRCFDRMFAATRPS